MIECAGLCRHMVTNCSAFILVNESNCELADASGIVLNPDPGDKAFILEGFDLGSM